MLLMVAVVNLFLFINDEFIELLLGNGIKLIDSFQLILQPSNLCLITFRLG